MKRAVSADAEGEAGPRKMPTAAASASEYGPLNKDVWWVIMEILRRTLQHKQLARASRKMYDIMRLQTTWMRMYNNYSEIRPPGALARLPRPALMKYELIMRADERMLDHLNVITTRQQQSTPGFTVVLSEYLLIDQPFHFERRLKDVSVITVLNLDHLVMAIEQFAALDQIPMRRWPCFRAMARGRNVMITEKCTHTIRRHKLRYLVDADNPNVPGGWPFEPVPLEQLRAESEP